MESVDRRKALLSLAKAIVAVKEYRDWKTNSKAQNAHDVIMGIVAESPRTGRWCLDMLKRLGYISNPIKIDQFMILDVIDE